MGNSLEEKILNNNAGSNAGINEELISGTQALVQATLIQKERDEFDFDSIFKNVRFSSIIPKPKNILYEGIVNGNISLSKRSEVYSGRFKEY